MAASPSTVWDLIESAAAGRADALQQFAERYQELVRGWLTSRWRDGPNLAQVDDALQEVFLECVKRGGALVQADRDREFRPYLHGVVRNVAARHETRRARDRRRRGGERPDLDGLPQHQTTASQAIDGELARALVREAGDAMAARAARLGGSAVLRVEILRLRFREDLSIRAIAARWEMDAAAVHHQYAKARSEFRRQLEEVVAHRLPGPPDQVRDHCDRLLDLLRKP